MKRGLKIGIICGASVIGVAIITLVTIALTTLPISMEVMC